MRRLRGKLTYSNVIATLALFIALGGGALAATHLGKNSVGTNQLKKNSVVTSKIKNGTVSGAKLANGAITGEKVQGGSLTGTQINASTLGTVPTAQTANSLVAPEAWHEVGTPDQPGFLNSWANSTAVPIRGVTVAFYKDQEGVVHLRGAAVAGTGDTPIFDLPPGFRPASGNLILEPVSCSGGGCPNNVNSIVIVGSHSPVPANEGAVFAPPEAEDVFLDGVTFRAES